MTLRRNMFGFTVIEGLVAVSVSSAMIMLVTVYMIDNIQQSSLATARQDMVSETQQTLDAAANDIRLSANADTNNRWADTHAPGGSGSPYSWASNSSVLVLAQAAEDTNGIIMFSDPNNYITHKNNLIYFVENGTLYRRTLASTVANNKAKTTCPEASASTSCPADTALLQNVTSFSVRYLDGLNQAVQPQDARSVELQVATSKQVYSETISANYTTKMVFRND